MKINRKVLQTALGEFSKIANKKDGIPMHSKVCMRTTGKGSCFISMQVIDVMLTHVARCTDDDDPIDEFWIDVFQLKALASGRCDAKDQIEINTLGPEGKAARIVCDGIETDTKEIDDSALEFEEKRKWKKTVEIEADKIAAAMQYATQSMTKPADFRNNLEGVFFDTENGRVVGCDGYTMNIALISELEKYDPFFVRYDAAIALKNISKKISEDSVSRVSVEKGDEPGWAVFRFIDTAKEVVWEVQARLWDCDYAPYQDFVPEKEPIAEFDLQEFTKRVKHVLKVEPKGMELRIENDAVFIQSLESEVGDVEINVPFEAIEKEDLIHFDPKLFLKILNTPDEETLMSVTNPGPNERVRIDIAGRFVGVIAPLKIEVPGEDEEDDEEENENEDEDE